MEGSKQGKSRGRDLRQDGRMRGAGERCGTWYLGLGGRKAWQEGELSIALRCQGEGTRDFTGQHYLPFLSINLAEGSV